MCCGGVWLGWCLLELFFCVWEYVDMFVIECEVDVCVGLYVGVVDVVI